MMTMMMMMMMMTRKRRRRMKRRLCRYEGLPHTLSGFVWVAKRRMLVLPKRTKRRRTTRKKREIGFWPQSSSLLSLHPPL